MDATEILKSNAAAAAAADAAWVNPRDPAKALGADGLRGELTLMRAARALAAFEGDRAVGDTHLKRVAAPALRHRLRRNPLEDAGSASRIERAIVERFGA